MNEGSLQLIYIYLLRLHFKHYILAECDRPSDFTLADTDLQIHQFFMMGRVCLVLSYIISAIFGSII